jgi:hypothetical protein
MLIIGCDFHTRYQQIAMAQRRNRGVTGRAQASGNLSGKWSRITPPRALSKGAPAEN